MLNCLILCVCQGLLKQRFGTIIHIGIIKLKYVYVFIVSDYYFTATRRSVKRIKQVSRSKVNIIFIGQEMIVLCQTSSFSKDF
jgi:hypothetical protein